MRMKELQVIPGTAYIKQKLSGRLYLEKLPGLNNEYKNTGIEDDKIHIIEYNNFTQVVKSV
jgi:hypothetical protein